MIMMMKAGHDLKNPFQTDLQTSSQRLTLSGTANMPVAKLDPEESFDQVIQHEVKELGTHM